MDRPLHIALIYGSVRDGRLCSTIANWVINQIEMFDNLRLEKIDPIEIPTLRQQPFAMTGPEVRDFRRQIAEADGFIVVTPEYNHGYPGPLKALIDSVYVEWQAKPVAFVSYGGVSGGLRAVEQLRQVFAELHMVTVRDGVSFSNASEQFASDGKLLKEDQHVRAIRILLARLQWWATSLRNAREADPYIAKI